MRKNRLKGNKGLKSGGKKRHNCCRKWEKRLKVKPQTNILPKKARKRLTKEYFKVLSFIKVLLLANEANS